MQLELDLVYPLRMGIPIKNGGFYGKTIGKIHGKYRGHFLIHGSFHRKIIELNEWEIFSANHA
jgi:hypothetical protein